MLDRGAERVCGGRREGLKRIGVASRWLGVHLLAKGNPSRADALS